MKGSFSLRNDKPAALGRGALFLEFRDVGARDERLVPGALEHDHADRRFAPEFAHELEIAHLMRDLLVTLEPYTYRIYAYFVLTIFDDPAILAMEIF